MGRLGPILIVVIAVPLAAVSRSDDGPGSPHRPAAEWVGTMASPEASERARAARALGHLGSLPDDARTVLVAALNDAEPVVRARAAIALARHKGPLESVLPALLAGRRVSDKGVRAEAQETGWPRVLRVSS